MASARLYEFYCGEAPTFEFIDGHIVAIYRTGHHEFRFIQTVHNFFAAGEAADELRGQVLAASSAQIAKLSERGPMFLKERSS